MSGPFLNTVGPFLKMQLQPYKEESPLSIPNGSLYALPIQQKKKRVVKNKKPIKKNKKVNKKKKSQKKHS